MKLMLKLSFMIFMLFAMFNANAQLSGLINSLINKFDKAVDGLVSTQNAEPLKTDPPKAEPSTPSATQNEDSLTVPTSPPVALQKLTTNSAISQSPINPNNIQSAASTTLSNADENDLLLSYFKDKKYIPQILDDKSCLDIADEKTLCFGVDYKQLININSQWDIAGISLNSPISVFNGFECVSNGDWISPVYRSKESPAIAAARILGDGFFKCAGNDLYWQINVENDSELRYFYISGIYTEQCGPYQIQLNSDLVSRLSSKYGKPVSTDFSKELNTLIELEFRNNISNEIVIVRLNDNKDHIGGRGGLKSISCQGGRSLLIQLYTPTPREETRILSEMKSMKRNLKSSKIQPRF